MPATLDITRALSDIRTAAVPDLVGGRAGLASVPAPAASEGDRLVPAPGADGRASDLLRGRLMQCSLRKLLDRVPGSRSALPHLAALEGLLAQQGASAMQGVSQRVLEKVHTQLNVLPLDPTDGSIHDLLTLVRRALRYESTKQTHQLSPFDPQSTVVITEGSETDFMNALHDARGGH